MNLLEEIKHYWNHRYSGYSKVNQKELEGIQRERWKEQFKRLLPTNKNLKVLDIGTGPGFFTIILEELGYKVRNYEPSFARYANVGEVE